jgi:hypothetical protein
VDIDASQRARTLSAILLVLLLLLLLLLLLPTASGVPPELLALDRVQAYKYAQLNWGATPDAEGSSNPKLWRTVVIVVLVCTMCLALLLLLLLGCAGSRHFSKLQFLLGHQRKRAMGKPSNGRLSVVVTDIQGYSQLMDECPEDMQQVCVVCAAAVNATLMQFGYHRAAAAAAFIWSVPDC